VSALTEAPVRARGAGGRPRAAWRITLAAGLALAALGVTGAMVVLGAGNRDVVAHLGRAPAMRIVEIAGAVEPRIRRLELADAVGPVQARIRYAPDAAGPAPAVVILGGLRTGRGAVELVDPDLPYVVAALDHAWSGPRTMSGLGLMARLPLVQRDLMRTAVALRDLMRLLERDPRVAGGRVYVVAASLGTPMACAAAAAERPTGLVLLYGFADHATLLEYRLRPYVASPLLRAWIARAGASLTTGFDAARTLPRLCGTPVLVVGSAEDRDMPRGCGEALWKAACEPRLRVELPGGHIRSGRDPELLRQATTRVTDWIAEIERASP